MHLARGYQHHDFRHENAQDAVIKPVQNFAPVLHQVGAGFQAQNSGVQKNEKNQSMLNPAMRHEGFNAVLPAAGNCVNVCCCHRYH